MSYSHPTDADDDDDFVPPTPIAAETRIDICPACSRPLAKHSGVQLLRCTAQYDDDDGEQQPAAAVSPPRRRGPNPHVDHPIPSMFAGLAIDDPASRRERRESQPESTPERTAEQREDEELGATLQRTAVALLEDPAMPSRVALPSAEIDYEELALGLRTVIERERDEIVRRGGPLEKQNAQLKERIAELLEEVNILRRRLQTTAEARNSALKQCDDQTKMIRGLRNELKGRKENNTKKRVMEIPEMMRIAETTPGWSIKRLGNGHIGFYLHGNFITDAASSGQGNKVNMATRLKLVKAGLDV